MVSEGNSAADSSATDSSAAGASAARDSAAGSSAAGSSAAGSSAPERSAPKRGTEEIRAQLTAEREQLTSALAELRQDVQSARRIPMIIGGALLAGIAAFAAFKAVRGDD
jgi:hypothetical protein